MTERPTAWPSATVPQLRRGPQPACACRAAISPAAPGTTSRRSCATSACVRRGSAWRSAGSCSRKGDRHVTAEMLYEEANHAKVPVSLATVYNTLHQFTEVGLLRQVAVDGSKAYFDTNNSEHHHFFIEDQNDLMDIPSSDVVVGKAPVPPEGYEIARIDVVVRLRRKGR